MNHVDRYGEIINDVFRVMRDDVLTQLPARSEKARGIAAPTSVCSPSDMLNSTLVISTLAESLSLAASVEATSAEKVLRPLPNPKRL